MGAGAGAPGSSAGASWAPIEAIGIIGRPEFLKRLALSMLATSSLCSDVPRSFSTCVFPLLTLATMSALFWSRPAASDTSPPVARGASTGPGGKEARSGAAAGTGARAAGGGAPAGAACGKARVLVTGVTALRGSMTALRMSALPFFRLSFSWMSFSASSLSLAFTVWSSWSSSACRSMPSRASFSRFRASQVSRISSDAAEIVGSSIWPAGCSSSPYSALSAQSASFSASSSAFSCRRASNILRSSPATAICEKSRGDRLPRPEPA
mmetsp:Transcript_22161/g.66058  ORF Transcript_22161/g.66058 Transcript_22161/m.66058 type:complete len:267 (-) Transcript_22161:3-803(-)